MYLASDAPSTLPGFFMILNPPYGTPGSQKLRAHDASVSPDVSGTTTLVPLGGCGEFGRNMTALVCDGDLFIIDCGILFSQEPHLGLSGIFFDITPWVQRYGAPKAYIITHAHRDHVGALMYFLRFWPAAVYATAWTMACLEGDIERQQKPEYRAWLRLVDEGQRFSVGKVSFEYISVNHSIPESCSLYIETPYHRIAHSGDFKIDHHSSLEPPADLRRWEQIAAKSTIDVFLCDSTNAHLAGASLSEERTRESLTELFGELKGRIFISTFSSNLWRLIHIIQAAQSTGRKVHVLGFGMNKTLEIGQNLGFYNPSSAVLSQSGSRRGSKLSAHEINTSHQRGDVFLVSGSQMEPRSVLARILEGRYGALKIEAGDTVVFSSRTIPGHERALIRARGLIMWQGARVITADLEKNIHVSGHAYNTDIEIMLSVIRPRYFIPIHGELSHLMSNALARTDQKTFMWRNEEGCLLRAQHIYPYCLDEKLQQVYVDRNEVLLEPATVEERRDVARGGVVSVSGVYALQQRRLSQEPSFQQTGTPWTAQWFKDQGIPALLQQWAWEYLDQEKIYDGSSPQDAMQDLSADLSQRLFQHLVQLSGGVRAKVMVHMWLVS